MGGQLTIVLTLLVVITVVVGDLHLLGLGLGLGGQLEKLRGQALGARRLDGPEDVRLEALVVRFARGGAGALGHFFFLSSDTDIRM